MSKIDEIIQAGAEKPKVFIADSNPPENEKAERLNEKLKALGCDTMLFRANGFATRDILPKAQKEKPDVIVILSNGQNWAESIYNTKEHTRKIFDLADTPILLVSVQPKEVILHNPKEKNAVIWEQELTEEGINLIAQKAKQIAERGLPQGQQQGQD